MASPDNQLYKYTRVNASVKIKDDQCKLGGLFCSSQTGATVTIYDGQTAGGAVVVPAFVPAAGINYSFPANLQNGCFIAITGTFDGVCFWN